MVCDRYVWSKIVMCNFFFIVFYLFVRRVILLNYFLFGCVCWCMISFFSNNKVFIIVNSFYGVFVCCVFIIVDRFIFVRYRFFVICFRKCKWVVVKCIIFLWVVFWLRYFFNDVIIRDWYIVVVYWLVIWLVNKEVFVNFDVFILFWGG